MYFCEFPPAHRSSVVNEKLSRTTNLTSILALFFYKQVITAYGLQFLVRQHQEGDSSLGAHPANFIRPVGADGNRLDTEGLKPIKTALYAP